MNDLWRDLRYGARVLVRNPGFALVSILALAIGIGANTAIFSLINSLLLRPLAYSASEQLVIIWNHSPGNNVAQDWLSPGQFSAIRSQTDVFDETNISVGGSVNLTGRETPERVGVIYTQSTLFPLLGVQPALGRAFLPEEDTAGKMQSVILSHNLWERRFNSDPNIIGEAITMNGRSFTVVGVMPAGFALDSETMPTVAAVPNPDLLVPLPLTEKDLQNQGSENYNVLARLKSGVSIKQAQAEVDFVARQLEQEHSDQYPPSRGFRFSVRPLLEQVVGDVRPVLFVLLGAVGCVLLIACANVANLMLARAAGRESEIAIRTALGAGRWRLCRQLLTESALLAVLGGALGILTASWCLDGLRSLKPGNIPRLYQIEIDGGVLAFAIAVTLLTTVLCGLAPAVRGTRINLTEALKQNARNVMGGNHRLRGLLVIAEIALSLVLLVGAGLLIRSFIVVQRVAPGFVARDVLSLRLSVVGTAFANDPRRSMFFRQLLEGVRQLPGVQSAGSTSILPLGGGLSWGSVSVEGSVPAAGDTPLTADQRTASVGYFETMKIPLLRGRLFTEQDTSASLPVALIDEKMAEDYWPGIDPIGKRIKRGDPISEDPWITIVGVVGNVKQYALDTDSRITFYIPQEQDAYSTVYLVARTTVQPSVIAGAITRAARTMDPNVPIYDVKSMNERLADSLARRRFAMIALGLFAVVAMLLAAVGIYGVMSYSVSQRKREIGIRVALGAESRDVLSLVVGHGMKLAFAGVAIGLGSSVGLTRLMSSMLYGVSASDPATFCGIGLILIAVALFACWVPARRALKVDPMVALRTE